MRNVGKIFEDCFVKSIDISHILVKRLNDNAASWGQGTQTRFTSTNECDFILFDDNSLTLYGLELKSFKSSLTFFREDFVVEEKHQSFEIKKNQILGLKKWSQHSGVFGFIFNVRCSENHTYFVEINDFLEYTNHLCKKSINESDILSMHHLKIECKLRRTNYHYDMEKFFQEKRLS